MATINVTQIHAAFPLTQPDPANRRWHVRPKPTTCPYEPA